MEEKAVLVTGSDLLSWQSVIRVIKDYLDRQCFEGSEAYRACIRQLERVDSEIAEHLKAKNED